MPPRPHSRAVVVGGGIIGLGAARALADDGFAVTVHEQHTIGTPLGSSPGRSRIFRRAYPETDYVTLAARNNDLWRSLGANLLIQSGLLLHGANAPAYAAAMEQAGQPGTWLEPGEAQQMFPEARFDGPVLLDEDAGAVLADEALRRLARGVEVREHSRIDDPRELEADVVCVCTGPWLARQLDLPLWTRIEQVSYFRGAPDDRPSVVDMQAERDGYYALVAPGVGYKVAESELRGEWDPDRPDRPVDAGIVESLRAYVARRFPGLDPDPVHSEACLFTHSPDEDFILDRIDGVIVCGGDSGHAFKFGPLLGRLIADLAQGRELPPEAQRFRWPRVAPATNA